MQATGDEAKLEGHVESRYATAQLDTAQIMERVSTRRDQIEDAIHSWGGARQLERRARGETETTEPRDQGEKQVLVGTVVRDVQEGVGAGVTLGDVEALR